MGSKSKCRLPRGLFPACADLPRDCCLKARGIASCTSLCELVQIRALPDGGLVPACAASPEPERLPADGLVCV